MTLDVLCIIVSLNNDWFLYEVGVAENRRAKLEPDVLYCCENMTPLRGFTGVPNPGYVLS